jgi:ligand-binding sensor domain-containing protein
MLKYFLILLLCLVCSSPFFAQKGKLSFKNIGIEEGLPSSETFDVVQDDAGRIWFATDKGVVAYDGNESTLYTIKDGLINDVVLKIKKDQFGRLWFLTIENRLCYFEKDKIIPFKFNHLISKNILKSSHPDHDLYVDRDSTLYYSVRNIGAFKITRNGVFTSLNDTDEISFYKIESEILWVFKNLQALENHSLNKNLDVNFYDERGKSFIVNIVNRTKIAVSYGLNSSLILVNDKIIDLKSKKEIYSENGIVSLVQNKNKIYIGLKQKGVKVFSYSGGKLTLEDWFLEKYSISSIYFDNCDGLWISTLENGIFYCPSSFIRNYDTETGLESNSIWSITKHNNHVYLGFDQNTYSNWTKKYTKRIESPLSYLSLLLNYNDKLVLSNGCGMFIDGRNVSKEVSICINDFYIQNEIYFTSREWVGKFSMEKGISILNKFEMSKILIFESIMVDNKNDIWLGSRDGLFFLKNGSITKAKINGLDQRTRVKDMLYNPNYGHVLGTRGEGVLIKPIGKNVFERVEEINGNHINCLFVDGQNRIWIGSNKGVNVLRLNENGKYEIISFTTQKGLISNEINTIYVDKKYAYIGTNKGLTTIDLSIVKFNRKKYQIKLSRFLVENKLISFQENDKELLISHEEDKIEIHFGTINFITRGKYKYRLNKKSKWIEIDQPIIQLYNLESGEYDVEVLFKDEDNNWSESQVVASFEIDAPYWEKNYFKVGLLLIASLLIYLFIRSKRKQFETKQKMIVLEQKALFAQMNPHFIFNTMNSIQSFLIYNENEKAEFFLLKFSKLLRETLHISRTSTVSIEKEISMLKKYLELEQMRFSEKFDFNIESNFPDDLKNVRIPNMLLQPFIENSLKHGFIGTRSDFRIDLQLIYINDKLIHCIIQDNGIGRMASENMQMNNSSKKNHVSYGEKITNERLDSYNKKLKTKIYYTKTTDLYCHNLSVGTKVEIFIPIIKASD